MKNIKFKVLIMFMLLVLVGLGSSSVLGKTEEYLKTSDLYKFDSGYRYIFYGPDGHKLYILNDVKWKPNFENQVLNKVVQIGGVEYIKYSDWVRYWTAEETAINMGLRFEEEYIIDQFGKSYYEFMMKFEYNSGKDNFEEALDLANPKDVVKEMKKLYSAQQKGSLLVTKYLESNGKSIYDYIGYGDTLANNLVSELWEYLFSRTSIGKTGSYNKEVPEFVNSWGKYDIYGYQTAYSDYHKTLKVSIDVPDSNPTPEPEKNPQDYEEGINNFWENAFDWFKGAQSSGGMGTVTDGFMKGATNIIKMVGNMIFIVVTSILGVKYIWGSADAKYSVKNSLFSLVIAAVMFYGWDSISNIIQTVTNSTVGNNIESTAKTIYTYILYFVNIAAIGGIVFLGVKYLLASAEGKSQLKMNMGPAFLGIIMVYATISFLNTILNIFLG